MYTLVRNNGNHTYGAEEIVTRTAPTSANARTERGFGDGVAVATWLDGVEKGLDRDVEDRWPLVTGITRVRPLAVRMRVRLSFCSTLIILTDLSWRPIRCRDLAICWCGTEPKAFASCLLRTKLFSKHPSDGINASVTSVTGWSSYASAATTRFGLFIFNARTNLVISKKKNIFYIECLIEFIFLWSLNFFTAGKNSNSKYLARYLFYINIDEMSKFI